MKAYLVLEDGEVFTGNHFGKEGEIFGEVVFNTSMTGYQEILTDPSYAGQLVTMTYPLIGNYGINPEDIESYKPHVRGFIIRKLCRNHSNFRAMKSLEEYLKENGIIGIEGIDTRRLTLHIREKGAMRGVISSLPKSVAELKDGVLKSPYLHEEDLVGEVSASSSYIWDPEGFKSVLWPGKQCDAKYVSPYKVAVIDFGVKTNILRMLRQHFSEVKVFPSNVTYEELNQYDFNGLFLSNGPGDPQNVKNGIKIVRKVLGKKPVFGICLGHQILSLALGAKTYKLKFGHRGANQPVKSVFRNNIEITSQNHGYAVDPESLKEVNSKVVLTHENLNDHTNEGISAPELKAFSVQYHPESSPGPHDSRYLFEDFIKLIKESD